MKSVLVRLAGLIFCQLLVLLSFTGCESVKHWGRSHGDADTWGRAATPLNPNHLGSIILLASTPYFAVEDRDLVDDMMEDEPLDVATSAGDVAQIALAVSPLAGFGFSAIAPAYEGEALELLEVGIESALLTSGVTLFLKETVHRKRPSGENHRSFPSGHVSASMAGATTLGRWLRTKHPGFFPVELGLYAGVGYVAISRIENGKHFPLDTVAGAIFGGYITNTLWDAHYGREEEDGFFDHMRNHVVPAPAEDGLGLFYITEF